MGRQNNSQHNDKKSKKGQKENIKRQARMRVKKRMQEEVLQQSAKASKNLKALYSKSFDISYEPPKGVPEDEFNSFEKIFFAFQKRSFEKYINSFVRQYYQMTEENPRLKATMDREDMILRAKVTFDKKGNLLAIKIYKSVDNGDVHRLFEETLKGIVAIPNPPKFMVEEDDQFNIYYSLKIN